ncbi:MAG TPA: MFS transporter, partial [Candidatus Baltobacteraceae bacterium]|nr:MFS transporter [Candidatus Baltobacteraceae bacterium]
GSAGLVWFYAAPVFSQAFAAVLLVQFGMNLAIGPYQAALPDYIEEERLGNASSWMAGLQSLGNAAGAVVAGLVSDTRLVAAGIVVALLSTCGLTASHAAKLTRLPAANDRVQITQAYTDLFVSRALVYLGFYTLLGYLFFFIQETLGSAQTKAFTGYTLLAVTIAGSIGAVFAAKPADRYDQRAVACIGGAAFALAIALLIAMHTAPGIIVCGALAGAAWGIFLTADWALGCRFVPRAHAATALGIWNLALLLPQIAAPLLVTLVLRSMHSLNGSQARVAFVVALLEITAGSIWIWRLPARRSIG